jgi:hypothetical protein
MIILGRNTQFTEDQGKPSTMIGHTSFRLVQRRPFLTRGRLFCYWPACSDEKSRHIGPRLSACAGDELLAARR